MNITPDTNVLVRILMNDDPEQTPKATAALRSADQIALAPSTICEVVWVLRSFFNRSPRDIAQAIRWLTEIEGAVVDTTAIEAGITCLEAGADFADGIIAYEGRQLGCDVFVTFDRKAARALTADKIAVELLI